MNTCSNLPDTNGECSSVTCKPVFLPEAIFPLVMSLAEPRVVSPGPLKNEPWCAATEQVGEPSGGVLLEMTCLNTCGSESANGTATSSSSLTHDPPETNFLVETSNQHTHLAKISDR